MSDNNSTMSLTAAQRLAEAKYNRKLEKYRELEKEISSTSCSKCGQAARRICFCNFRYYCQEHLDSHIMDSIEIQTTR